MGTDVEGPQIRGDLVLKPDKKVGWTIVALLEWRGLRRGGMSEFWGIHSGLWSIINGAASRVSSPGLNISHRALWATRK